MVVTVDESGAQYIKKLLIKQAVSAIIGILFILVYALIDTIFVGQWIGSLSIAAATVILPITFLISSLGMAIGAGGGSVLSRALGHGDNEKASLIFIIILVFAKLTAVIFITEALIIDQTPEALRWVFAASSIIAIQLIGTAYFQAAGKAKKTLLPTSSKQGFFLIPLVLILPNYLGVFSVWIAFSIAYVLATILTGHYLKKRNNHKTDLNKKWNIIIT